jgi:hypothetical protein
MQLLPLAIASLLAAQPQPALTSSALSDAQLSRSTAGMPVAPGAIDFRWSLNGPAVVPGVSNLILDNGSGALNQAQTSIAVTATIDMPGSAIGGFGR